MSAGRSCPLHYRYAPETLGRASDAGLQGLQALYVAGGVYGNLEALEALLEMYAAEPSASKALVFNGDFHWFDIDPRRFSRVQDLVLRHHALRGNVETELADADAGADCGCAYPGWVSQDVVDRSNRILQRLRTATTAAQRRQLRALPMTARAQVGGVRVGIVHGDAESLSGWGLAQEHLREPEHRARADEWLQRGNIDILASSHTCLPVFRRLPSGYVLNNGAAGLPNFRGDAGGFVVRVGISPHPEASIRAELGGVCLEGLKLRCQSAAQREAFLRQWPPGSDAYASYWTRICEGPAYDIDDVHPD